MNNLDPIPAIIENTLKAILLNNLDLAKNHINTIRENELYLEREELLRKVKNKRKEARKNENTHRGSHDRFKKEVFEKYHYTCAYCNRKTIDLEVLKVISRTMPDVFPYHKNWKFSESHILYWIYSTSLDHIFPLALGGKNDPSNMVASCYLCNDAKSDITLEDLGWELCTTIENSNNWSGLTEYLPQLNNALKEGYSNKKSSNSLSLNSPQRVSSLSNHNIQELFIGNFIRTCLPGKKSRRQYRVDDLRNENVKMVKLTEMWKEDATKKWVASKNPVTVMTEKLSGTELISETAPSEG